MEHQLDWLHVRPDWRPAGPRDTPLNHPHTALDVHQQRSETQPAVNTVRATQVRSGCGSNRPHFRTKAFDHIRDKEDTGEASRPHNPTHLLPLGPSGPRLHGPSDTQCLLSPVPTALPTERNMSTTSLRFLSREHRLSPRALSPVSARDVRALSPVPVNLTDMHIGALRIRPPNTELAKLEPSFRRSIQGSSRPRPKPRDSHLDSSVGTSDHLRRRLVPDLDASIQSVHSMMSITHNTSIPLSPRDDVADSVQGALFALEQGQMPRALNLRGTLDPEQMQDIESLFNHIAASKSIQTINMSCNHFTNPMSWALERLLERTRSCRTLRLGNNRMTDKMCSGAITSLHKNTGSGVTEVYLGNNLASGMTAEVIAKALRPGTGGGLRCLRVLNISHNRLGDTGGSMIVAALQDNVSLRVLDVGSNDLASKTRGALCNTLKFNRRLQEIRIERNPGLEDHGLIDILTTIRFSTRSQLVMLYTIEPLGMFCMDADISGREIKHWDNRKVIRFIRDIRVWYEEPSKVLFPISCQMWTRILRCIKKVENDLSSRVFLGWYRVCYARAVSRVRRAHHMKQAIKRPYFNLWVNMLTQSLEEPRFLERCRMLQSKAVLLHLTLWKLCCRHKRPYATGTKWTWRILLSEDALHMCQRAIGKADFASLYAHCCRHHFLWHTVSVKHRNNSRRVLSLTFASWAASFIDERRRVKDLTARSGKHVTIAMWASWNVFTEASVQRKKVMQGAIQRLTRRQLTVGFLTWKEVSDEAVIYKRKVQKIMAMLGYGQLGTTLVAWKKVIAKKRTAEKNVLKSENSVLKLLAKREKWCINQWRAVNRWKKRQRQKIRIGSLHFACKAFAQLKGELGFRREEKISQNVITYKYQLRRCKTMLRQWYRILVKFKHLRQSLQIVLMRRAKRIKKMHLTPWHREATGTRLYKKRYGRLLQLKAGGCWKWRIDFEAQIRRLAAKLARPRNWRMMLASCMEWREVVIDMKLKKQELARLMYMTCRRDEASFFTSWVEEVQRIIRNRAKSRIGSTMVWKRHFELYLEAVKVSVRRRRAILVLSEIGRDRYYIGAFQSWNQVVFENVQRRAQAIERRANTAKQIGLTRAIRRQLLKILLKHWQVWRLSTCVPRSFVRGSEAYRGLFNRSELLDFCRMTPRVNVPQLIEKMCLKDAGEPGLVLMQVLSRWHKLQCDGDLGCALELHRFMCFLFGKWTGAEVPTTARFGTISLVPKSGSISVCRSDKEEVILSIPSVDTDSELCCRIQRALARSLSPSFCSVLSLPCPLLQAAHEFCREFLRVPPGFLDYRGDHECWTARRARSIGDPARNHVCPQGWARVGVHVDDGIIREHSIWDKWNVSYYAVRQEMLAQIIHSRMLLRPGDVGAKGRTMQTTPGPLAYLGEATNKTKFVVVPQSDGPDTIEEYNSQDPRHNAEAGAEDFFPSKHFFTTPSVIFASQLRTSAPVTWRRRKVQVLLQTRQRPGATRILAFYDKEQATPIDSNYPNEEIRWFTPCYGSAAIAVTGILFRFAE